MVTIVTGQLTNKKNKKQLEIKLQRPWKRYLFNILDKKNKCKISCQSLFNTLMALGTGVMGSLQQLYSPSKARVLDQQQLTQETQLDPDLHFLGLQFYLMTKIF